MKKQTVSSLKKKLDQVFSEYIRKRDCLDTTGSFDYGVCCTCGVTYPYKKLQCGHFQSRKASLTRYHEKNTSAQCVGCNMFKAGEQYKFAQYIDKKYGDGTADLLQHLATETHQWKIFELEEMIETYKSKIKALEDSQGVFYLDP